MLPSSTARLAVCAILLFALLPGCTDSRAGNRADSEYFETLPRFWGILYADGGETLYCGKRFGKRHGRRINAEHVFPMAWVTKSLKCGKRKQCRRNSRRFNTIEADMHNIFPALSKINQLRSAYAFAELPGEPARGKCDFEVDEKRRLVEPRPAVRGDIARAMFYMSKQYGLKLYRRQRELLLRWHRQDPPSEEERRRNDIIQKLQGKRNRFIDNPALAGLEFRQGR
ncbi:MAG TPA: endonuclease I [Gammaproteobacteria bacterium]|nr:endonuclease I [Gammaproteobacteria bacterium]